MNPKIFDIDKYSVPDETVIWRYMDLSKLLDILVNEYIIFPRLDSFEDVYEGNPLKFKEAMLYAFDKTGELNLKEKVAFSVDTWFRLTRVRTYISCWHMNDFESAGMWKLYCKSNESLVIKTTLGRLKKSLVHPNTSDIDSLVFGKVDYSHNVDQLKAEYFQKASKKESIDLSFFDTSFSKRPSFQHEHELRVIAFKHDKIINSDDKDLSVAELSKTTPYVQPINCDVNKLIDSIVIAPDAPHWFVELVKSLVQKLGYEFTVSQSELYTLK